MILDKLFSMQDLKYREFQSKLMPLKAKDEIIGVRTPDIRRLAEELFNTEEAELFMNQLPHKYYEENNLHGFLIEKVKDFDKCISELNRFLPYVDNWATCDSINPPVFRKNKGKLLKHIYCWIRSGECYTVRFGLKILMNHYLEEDFKPEYLESAADIKSDEYYVKMMIAWFFATALAKQYETAVLYLEQGRLDIWVHNKTISKAVDSYRITQAQKEYIKRLRRR